MSEQVTVDPKLDFAIERFIDAPTRLVWEALTKPEHIKEWYMPKAWGRVSHTEMELRPGGVFRIDIAVGDGREVPNLGCVLEAVPMKRLVWTSMLFPGYRPAVFDDVPITAIMTMEAEGTGTRYILTALHRNEADLETNKSSGFYQGTEIAVDQFVEHVQGMKQAATRNHSRTAERGRDQMGKLVFGMMQSLDGYIAGAAGGPQLPPPGELLHRHFNDHVRSLAGAIYGRRMYEIMRYWDEDQADWDAIEHDFAAAWRATPKWVVSRTLDSVGPNATLVRDDVGSFVRALKSKLDGEIDVAGPELAGGLTALGLIDEYRLYFRPFVLGGGKPYFAGARPPLRFVSAEPVGEDAVKVTYAAPT